MTVTELCARFPEISPNLRTEPILSEFAERFGDMLAVASKPGNCSSGHDAGNRFYVELLGPISYYGYGLATMERVNADLRALLDAHSADPEAFMASLLPEGTVTLETKGPGCA